MPFIFNKGALDDNASLFILLMNLGNRSLAKEMENFGKQWETEFLWKRKIIFQYS